MNIENFNQITIKFQKDITKDNLINHLNELVENLANFVNQPQHPTYQQNIANIRTNLKSILEKSETNKYSPYSKEILDEIGFKNLRGIDLSNRIESSFLNNSITPSIAHQEISGIQANFNKLFNALTSTNKNFEILGIKSNELENNQSEIGIIIPRLAVKEKIDYFIKELQEIKLIIGDFNELAIGSRPEIELKTIASSEYQILLNILPVTATCLIISIEKLIKIYKDILDIRKARRELKEKGVPDENLSGIEQYANSKMENGITESIQELITKFGTNLEDGRKRELEISLKYSMNKISNRIDQGYNFDIKMKIEESKKNKETSQSEEDKLNEEYNKIITEKNQNLEFLKLTGESILSLPESEKK
ncbi:hypothetical protein CH372_18455 [Leptospira meyeri]|uniref:hypothetical protein n=1 Tax=Leptospira meyeri TaxID=29508 RepID=UPI000C2A59A1|nr:hypothetical protein [Leptospira meyeri]PKA10624.1 hypothetical protein CH372_18455 [Leptospira meyeri]PKA23939.1 hypothetical protein CH381_23055 [Leptospira sp. mixed culture ATI2-C-A1]